MQDNTITPELTAEEKLQQAELAAQQSREQFGEALGQLADRVDETTATAKKVMDVATAPGNFVKDTVGAAREAIKPGLDNIVRETKQAMSKAVDHVKSNPRPYIIGATAFCAGALLLIFLARRQTKRFDTL